MKFYDKNRSIIWSVGVVVLLFIAWNFVNPAPLGTSFEGKGVSMDMAEVGLAREDSGFAAEEKRIRYNSWISIESDEYDSAKTELNKIPEKFGGYFTNQNEYKSTIRGREYRTFRLTFKVPVEDFNSAIEEVKKIGDVKNLNVDASDLTLQYTDAKAYLDSYTAEKEKVEELLERAETVEETIRVQERLSELQRQIDSYQKQITNLERQTDFSQISATLEEKRPLSEGFYQWTGIRQHIRNVVRSFDSILVFLSSMLAWLLVIFVGWLIYKKVKK